MAPVDLSARTTGEVVGAPGETVAATADARQLDLFVDGRDAILVHEIVVSLIRRDGERAAAHLRRLGEEHPGHPDRETLATLVEGLRPPVPAGRDHGALAADIEDVQRRLVPAARLWLGTDAETYLRPRWRALAAAATGLVFTPRCPRAHRAWLCLQSADWAEARAAMQTEPGWAQTYHLRYWMGLAEHHLGADEVAIRLWLPLCWIDPDLFAVDAPALPNPTIRSAWLVFEGTAPFEGAPAWFPPWLLVRHPGLARLFEEDGHIPDGGDASRVFRHLLTLLALEGRGITEEVVRQRRALKELDGTFFRYYMAARGDLRR